MALLYTRTIATNAATSVARSSCSVRASLYVCKLKRYAPRVRSHAEAGQPRKEVDVAILSMDELMWAIETVRLRTSGEENTKEAAIIRAIPHLNSKGGGA